MMSLIRFISYNPCLSLCFSSNVDKLACSFFFVCPGVSWDYCLLQIEPLIFLPMHHTWVSCLLRSAPSAIIFKVAKSARSGSVRQSCRSIGELIEYDDYMPCGQPQGSSLSRSGFKLKLWQEKM